MAIYVYKIIDGALASYCPNDSDPVAPDSDLSASGLAKKSGLHPLDEIHAWDPPTQSVIVVVPLKSTPSLLVFFQRFTTTEREAIENMLVHGTAAQQQAIGAFYRYVEAAQHMVDCNDSYVQTKVNQLETIGLLAAGRAAQILV